MAFSRRLVTLALAAAAALGLATVAGARTGGPVPSGATASVTALRQAYLDGVKARKPEALAALYDLSTVPAADRAEFYKFEFGDLDQVTDATIIEPDPHVLATFKESHVRLSRPVVKMLKISLRVPKGQSLTTDWLIAMQQGRYFFILAEPPR